MNSESFVPIKILWIPVTAMYANARELVRTFHNLDSSFDTIARILKGRANRMTELFEYILIALACPLLLPLVAESEE